MKAMLLAAGLGSRMGELTRKTPKPLLQIGRQSLIEHQLEKIQESGIDNVIINVSHLGEQIQSHLQDSHSHLKFSVEHKPLETAGGIIKALPLLGDTFLVSNSDIWCDHPLTKPTMGSKRAHLILVPNPEHNHRGDFHFQHGQLHTSKGPKYTYSGIAWYRAEFFRGLKTGKQALGPLLRKAISKKQVSAEVYTGTWIDVGTPERLNQVRAMVSSD